MFTAAAGYIFNTSIIAYWLVFTEFYEMGYQTTSKIDDRVLSPSAV